MTSDQSPPTGVDALVEIEAIKRCKYHYLRCLDQKRWDDLSGCLLPDCTAAYSGGRYSFSGRDEIVQFLERSMGREDFLSSHRCTHPEIDLQSPVDATGTWALDDTVIIGEYDLIVHGAAFYEDVYRKVDGRWYLAHTGYRRSFEQLIPRASIAGMALTASWWGTDGQSQLAAE
jgi:hypothetical protein